NKKAELLSPVGLRVLIQAVIVGETIDVVLVLQGQAEVGAIGEHIVRGPVGAPVVFVARRIVSRRERGCHQRQGAEDGLLHASPLPGITQRHQLTIRKNYSLRSVIRPILRIGRRKRLIVDQRGPGARLPRRYFSAPRDGSLTKVRLSGRRAVARVWSPKPA